MFLKNVKFLLSKRGISQQELSKVLKISKSTMSMILTGERNLTLNHLYILVDFFDLTCDQLLYHDLELLDIED